MNSEALRLLDDAVRAHDYGSHATFVLRMSELRALLSAQEPTSEHWMAAYIDAFKDFDAIGVISARCLYRRARELAKQEAK